MHLLKHLFKTLALRRLSGRTVLPTRLCMALAGIAMSTITLPAQTVSDLVINEVQVSNIDMFLSPVWNYDAWVEFYNPTDAPINLFHCFFSTDPDRPKMVPVTWQCEVPAHGHKVLWFAAHDDKANDQIPLDLDCEGGWFGICDINARTLLSFTYPEAVGRAAWARTTDGGSQWGWTAQPTPGAPNDGSAFADELLPAPEPDTPSCLFASGSVTCHVPVEPGWTLRYTTDGTTPVATSPAAEVEEGQATFTASQTTLLRMRFFADGWLPSPVTGRSFIRETKRSFDLPVISILTDPEHLYNDTIGIWTKGTNGLPGRGFLGDCNWNRDWDRPVNFDYLLPNGNEPIGREANIIICGGWSRPNDPHSFKLKANKVFYGANTLDYPFFSAKPAIRNRTVQLRNGGNDFKCRLFDAALQTILLSSGLNVDGQSVQPVVLYLNGKYKGLLNMREPNNKHYVYANYGLSDDDIDMFELTTSCYHQLCGTKDALVELRELSKLSADDAVYDDICSRLLDIDAFCNYMATQIWLSGGDWLSNHNNTKGFRERTPDGRYRFVLFDLDSAFELSNPFDYFKKVNYITNATDGTYGESDLPNIFYYLMDNARFRKRFADAYCLINGSVFEPTRCAAIIDSMAAAIRPVLAYESKSPDETVTKLKQNLTADRQSTMITRLKAYKRLQLSGVPTTQVTLSVGTPCAHLLVDDLPVPTDRFSGTLFLPATVQAVAPAGYRFVGWKDKGSGRRRSLIGWGHAWHYYDRGSLAGTGWKRNAYKDTLWSTAPAPYGFANGNRGIVTPLDYGTNASDKRPTYYFRTTVETDQPVTAATLDYRVDDGFVVYVNGTEAGRVNMPSGTVGYTTYASSTVSERLDGTLTLDASLFRTGSNLVAVEVHNCNAGSTDLYWDAALTVTHPGDESLFSTEATLALTEGLNATLEACFEPAADTEAPLTVCINEVSTRNDVFVSDVFRRSDWIELYNPTLKPVDVAGMTLGTSSDESATWCIAAGSESISTQVPPHGHLLVWCDQEEGTTALHAPFKLRSDSMLVTLTTADGRQADSFACLPHAGDESVGRYPDGGTTVCRFALPTPGAPNRRTTYAEPYDADLLVRLLTTIPSLPEEPKPDAADPDDAPLYDFLGRRITHPQPGQIVIQAGKKRVY